MEENTGNIYTHWQRKTEPAHLTEPHVEFISRYAHSCGEPRPTMTIGHRQKYCLLAHHHSGHKRCRRITCLQASLATFCCQGSTTQHHALQQSFSNCPCLGQGFPTSGIFCAQGHAWRRQQKEDIVHALHQKRHKACVVVFKKFILKSLLNGF